MDEYYCSKCNAILNYQDGFDPDKGYWRCTECGQELYGDNFPEGTRFPGTIWHCDECGAVLNIQYGFDDEEDEWECTECGYVNPLNEDEIYGSELEWEVSRWVEEAFSNFGGSSDSSSSSSSSTAPNVRKDQVSFADSFRKFLRRLKVALAITLVLAVCVTGFLVYRHITMSIPVGISSEWAEGENYKTVANALEKQGFTKVSNVALEDLSYDSIKESGIVSQVRLSRRDTFEADTKYPSYSPITVFYHSPKKVQVPFAEKDAKGMDYQEAVSLLREAGFGSIEVIEKKDLVFGVLDKPDTIKKITIDGEKKFSEGDSFPVDVDILVEYHAFRGK